MEDNTIEKMSTDTKVWFAKAVVGMILADGKIEKSELKYLNDIIGFLKNRDLIQKISDMLKNNEIPTLEPIDLVPNEALEILKHLTIMAVVDEDLANREVKYLKYVASQLQLDDGIAERFLSLAQEKLRKTKYKGKLTSPDFAEPVKCFDVNENSCMLYAYRPVRPQTCLSLQLLKLTDENAPEELYSPIEAEASWCKPVKSNLGSFVVRLAFSSPLSKSQGIELIKNFQADKT